MANTTIYGIRSLTACIKNAEATLKGCEYLRRIARAIGGDCESIRVEFFSTSIRSLRPLVINRNMRVVPGNEDIKTQNGIYHAMMLIAEEMLGKQDYKAFYEAFNLPTRTLGFFPDDSLMSALDKENQRTREALLNT